MYSLLRLLRGTNISFPGKGVPEPRGFWDRLPSPGSSDRQTNETHRLCPKSLTTPNIVHYIVSPPFCTVIQMCSGSYYTLYSGLRVSHNASQQVQPMVTNQAIFTIMHCAERQMADWVVSKRAFFCLLKSSLYGSLRRTPYVVTREQGMSEWFQTQPLLP